MAMREECKHFQSRTYANGETARFCVLGAAPDQPFSCPESCVMYERRFADVGWTHGSLVSPPTPTVPDSTAGSREDVLAAASEIVGAVAPRLFEERRAQLEADQNKSPSRWKFWKR
jgi:hypothetical protein